MTYLRYHQDFPDRVTRFDFETLEKSVNSIYAINNKYEFIYFNPYYIKFSEENDFQGNILASHPIGSSIQDVLSDGVVSEFYISNYQKSYDLGKSWSNEYECSSTSIFRKYHQRTYPMREIECMVVINSLMHEFPIELAHSQEIHDEMYIQADGYLYQCSNCRKTQQTKNPDNWDWIPVYIDNPEANKVSHTLCPICYEFYWKFAPRNNHPS